MFDGIFDMSDFLGTGKKIISTPVYAIFNNKV